jgi:hypothetical protein
MENGQIVTVILRTTIAPEDPYLSLAKAQAYSLRTGEAFGANRTSRTIRDSLIKTNISI